MPFTVVDANFKPLLQHWLEYCEERGYTPEVLAPMEGELLALEFAAAKLGKGVFAYKQFQVQGLFVYPVAPGEYQGRIIGPIVPLDVPKPGQKAPHLGKYFKPSGSSNRIYVPKHRSDWLNKDHPITLIIVESPMAANYLNYHGYYAVATGGIWNYNMGGKNTPMIPELKRLLEAPNVEKVILMPDSDTHDPEVRPDLWVAVNRVAQAILKVRRTREDSLYIARPPDRQDGSKNGPDDYLFQFGPDEFNRLLREQTLQYSDDPFLQIQNYALARFIYDETSNQCWDERNRQLVDLHHVDSIMATQGKALDITADRPKVVTYSHKHLLSCPGLRVAQGVRFQPDEDGTYYQDSHSDPPQWRINKFHPDDMPTPIKGDVGIAYKVLNALCRDSPAAVQKILTILARHAQFPATTPKYAILFTGEQGSSKSNFAKLCGLALSKRFSTARADMETSFNSNWRGYACREWAEFDKTMDEEWLKDLITGETYEVRTKYGQNYVEYNYTLNIFTCNGLQSKIQEGDRRFVIGGYSRADDKQLGLEFEHWLNGQGPSFFRHHLLNNVDCSGYDGLDTWTEMRDAVIAASQSYKGTVKDYVIEALEEVEGLEIVPNAILSQLLEPHKVNVISFNKEYGQFFVKPKLEVVKVDGWVQRFRCFKNFDKWRNEQDTAKYRDQFKLAQKLIKSSGKY